MLYLPPGAQPFMPLSMLQLLALFIAYNLVRMLVTDSVALNLRKNHVPYSTSQLQYLRWLFPGTPDVPTTRYNA